MRVDVLELFAEAQGGGDSPEWMGDFAHVIERKGPRSSDSLWMTDRAAYYREWRARNPERARAIVRAYQARHPERVKAKRAAAWARYYAKNRERILAQRRAASREAR